MNDQHRRKIPAEEIETRCPYDDEGLHNWHDITMYGDTDDVEICSNCNEERRRPRDVPGGGDA